MYGLQSNSFVNCILIYFWNLFIKHAINWVLKEIFIEVYALKFGLFKKQKYIPTAHEQVLKLQKICNSM